MRTFIHTRAQTLKHAPKITILATAPRAGVFSATRGAYVCGAYVCGAYVCGAYVCGAYVCGAYVCAHALRVSEQVLESACALVYAFVSCAFLFVGVRACACLSACVVHRSVAHLILQLAHSQTRWILHLVSSYDDTSTINMLLVLARTRSTCEGVRHVEGVW